MPETNRQVLLKRRPEGMPVAEDFAIVDGKLPEPGEGQVLLRGLYLSLDPYMRGRISGQRSYARPTEIGEVIEGRVVGRVARSRHPDFREGDYAFGGYGWQIYSAVDGGGLAGARSRRRADLHRARGSRHARPHRLCRAEDDRSAGKRGATVVISAASGVLVGAVAGQLAKREELPRRRHCRPSR